MGLLVNLGAGDDIRDGWLNLDAAYGDDVRPGSRPSGPWTFLDRDGRWRRRYAVSRRRRYGRVDRGRFRGTLVLLNHSLHQVDYSDADLVLDHAVRILAGGGRLVIVEADVLGILGAWEHAGMDCPADEAIQFVAGLISDDEEPTLEGKVLRWASWYGERRSLWSAESLADRLGRRGLYVEYAGPSDGDDEEWAGDRTLESITVVAVSLK